MNVEIRTRVHTIFLLIGPTECGKTTFAKELLIPALRFADESKGVQANVQYISSDQIRQELLGHDFDKYDQVMLEASEQAFHLLFEKVKMATSFPILAEFVVVDTTGLAEDFRAQIREIAKRNNYNLDVILFDYRKRDDYYASERSKKLITSHVQRLKKEVMRSLSKEGYTHIHRVRLKDFYSPVTCEANPEYKVSIENLDEYMSTNLPKDQKYIIVGDVHECVEELKGLLQSHGYRIDGDHVELTEKVQHTKVILAGDWIDKGKHTKEMIRFLFDNQEHFLLVMGNHENFVFQFLQGEIKGIDQELLENFFDSVQVLRESEELKEKFYHLHAQSKPFFKGNAPSGPTFYVTHSPCKNKYVGKLDTNSKRHQRNFRIDRSASLEEQLSFLKEEAVGNHPYHIFGHVAAKHAFRFKNKLHIDTGCVHGNALTAVVIANKPFLKTQKSNCTVFQEELLSFFQEERKVSIQDLAEEEIRRLQYCSRHKVNFISGTMAPADKDEASNELESLRSGLAYFTERGVQQVVLQPKYMGSRCNIYLHSDPEQCFAVSRNGYKINQVDLTEMYNQLLQKFAGYMQEKQIAMLILDGELLPWRAIGEGLIEKQFKPIEKALESEMEFLQQAGFDQAIGKLATEYKESGFEKDHYHKSKAELMETYGSRVYQTFRYARGVLDTYMPIEEHQRALQIYKKQLELYAGDGDMEYKPFALLKIVYKNGSEEIPDWRTSDVYSFLSDDEYLQVDLSEPDAYDRAAQFFSKMTLENLMEGLVIKPEINTIKTAPYMKVRNPEYLSIIYGYDYRFPHKYRKLLKQKNIVQKLRTSMKEYNLGSKLLSVPFEFISPEHDTYREITANLLFEVAKEKEMDPRL
ncbi:polynucleotide kinase-phosphatase [Brevibacillus reuszeri]|uniref:Polynucleotide kinase-phosphatase n=1 Tax=Brevibacillus reuszeri TaxID=54915 RepID=A0ABQ0TGE4_9BACL|nr:polynucleotide kinase-phosphatase [Brevibacillus reuszeri]